MTATDEQLRLLDKLRKLACDINEKEIRSHSVITLNQGRYNRQFRLDMNHEWLGAWHAEFERILRAIAATLGRGTCHLTSAPQYGEGCQECSACGAVMDGYLFDGGRCPNCRAKVVKE